MPYHQKVRKIPASISLTPEAWALVAKRSKDADLSKSEYIENLVRRGDQELYDLVRATLLDSLARSEIILSNHEQQIELYRLHCKLLRDCLVRLGISPNQI